MKCLAFYISLTLLAVHSFINDSEEPVIYQKYPGNYSISYKDTNFNDSTYCKNQTVVLIHGWTESPESIYYPLCTEKFIKKPDYTVIAVNWSKYAKHNYLAVHQDTPFIGHHIASFLCNMSCPNLDHIQLVTHSIGCQVGAFVGQYTKEICNMTLGKIDALSPAGPLFSWYISRMIFTDSHRLSKTDAKMVVVLYSNRGMVGPTEKIGTHNFVANSGTIQPNCFTLFNSDPISNAGGSGYCNHKSAVSFFYESIDHDNFVTCQCKKTIWKNRAVGRSGCKPTNVIYSPYIDADVPEGDYFFDTNKMSPYGLGKPEKCTAVNITIIDQFV